MMKDSIRIPVAVIAGLLVLCAAVWVGAGTTGIVAGVVRNSEDATPLAGANVRLEGTKMTTVSDANGYFIFTNVPPGQYEAVAAMVGFAEEIVADVRVTMDTTTSVDFDMKTEAIPETEVVVTRPRPMINADVPHTLNMVSAGQTNLTRSDPASMNTVPGVLSAMPGVVVSPDGLGQIHMRGGRADQVGYYIEGIPITDPNTGFFGTNLFTTGVGEFQMYAGGFGSEYGNAISGVLNEVKKTGVQAPGIRLDTEYGNQSYRNALVQFGDEVPSGFNYYLGSLLQTADVDGPVVKEQEYADNVVKLVWPWKSDSLTLLGLQGSLLGKPSDTDTLRQRYTIAAATWSHNFGPESFLQVRPYYMYSTTVFNYLSSDSLMDADSTQKGLQVRYSASIGGKHLLGAGGSLVSSDNNSYQFFGMPYSEANIDTQQADLYVDDTVKLDDSWTLQAGLRYDRMKYDRVGLDYINDGTEAGYLGDPVPDATESSLTPRLGLSYSPNDRTAWKLSWGRYTKFMPSSYVQTVYYDPAMVIDEYGTTMYESAPGLASTAPQKSTVLELAYERQLNDSLSLRITPFYSDYSNLVQTRVTDDFAGLVFDDVGQGTSKGVELFVRKRMSHNWQAWLSYTYAKSRANSQTEFYPIFGSPDVDWYTSWDQRHTLSLVTDYRQGRWGHNLRFDFGSGLADIWSPEDSASQGRANPHVIVSYTISRELPMSTPLGDSVYVSIFNVFNTHETLQYDWKSSTGRTRSAWVPSRFISMGVQRSF